MSLSRRAFVRSLGSTAGPRVSGAFVAARGREAVEAGLGLSAGSQASSDADLIRIDSNENPLGPGRHAIDALTGAFVDAGRYPTNARPSTADLQAAIARRFEVEPRQVVLGAGSREVLRNAVIAFTSADRPLVTAAPSFEQPERLAEHLGTPVRRVPVDAAGRLDLDGMAAAAKGAGLVFFCNPNNPTATLHPAADVKAFVAEVRRTSPGTAILIDEAYHDYVTDPAYASAAPLALSEPDVFIARTMSKAFGMAGLRIGYAVGQEATIAKLRRHAMTFNQNSLGVAAAVAALADEAHIREERARNTGQRASTLEFFRSAGFEPTVSQGNFVFVDLGRPAREFRDACREHGVLVGRPFPPLDKTHARISIGTADEMQRAVEVFSVVLGLTSNGRRQA